MFLPTRSLVGLTVRPVYIFVEQIIFQYWIWSTLLNLNSHVTKNINKTIDLSKLPTPCITESPNFKKIWCQDIRNLPRSQNQHKPCVCAVLPKPKRSGDVIEDVNHLLFTCPFARACWFVGPLPMRSDELPQNLKEVIESLGPFLSQEQWTDFINSLWVLWRCKNDRASAGQLLTNNSFKSYFQTISIESKIAATRGAKLRLQGGQGENLNTAPTNAPTQYYVDDSWSEQ